MRETRTRGLLAATLLLAACGDEAAEAPAADPASTVSPSATGDPVVADWASRSLVRARNVRGARLCRAWVRPGQSSQLQVWIVVQPEQMYPV